MDENEFIRRAMLGDTAALSQLLQKHYAFVYKYLVKITLNPSQAEDLTQETMVRCIEKIKLYNGTSKFSSWLITIATRLMIDQGRRRLWERKWQEKEQQQSLRQLQWQTAHHTDDAWPEVLDALPTCRVRVVFRSFSSITTDTPMKKLAACSPSRRAP